MNIENYTIEQPGTVTVDGNANISNKQLSEKPVQSRIVYRVFNCSYNILTTLNSPHRNSVGMFIVTVTTYQTLMPLSMNNSSGINS